MRLAAAHRCPAFENAEATVHSTARPRSASSQTTSAFLPPSSMQVFARRRPAASAIARPVAADPVKLTRSTPGSSTSGIPASGPRPLTTLRTPRGSPASRQSRPNHRAERGACSDGFRTAQFPQKIAGKAFHATLGSGVLNEIRSAATPTGRRSVSTVRWGIEAVVVRPYERRPSPATKSPISIAASVSPRASSGDLPVSAATSSLASSCRFAQELGDRADDVAALDGRARRPPGLGLPGGCHRCRRVVGAGPRHAAQRRAVGRPHLLEPCPGRRGPLLARDEVRHLRRDHQADQPPSTRRFAPVT